jgi:hypothetical protein
MAKTTETGDSQKDWVAHPLSFVWWWCVPIAIGVSTDVLGLPTRTAALVWAASFVWMAAGCLLNARRSRRLHCYISGPVFLLGAIVVVFVAAGFTVFGPHALNNVVSVTFVLVILSFVPEYFGNRYTPSR